MKSVNKNLVNGMLGRRAISLFSVCNKINKKYSIVCDVNEVESHLKEMVLDGSVARQEAKGNATYSPDVLYRRKSSATMALTR